MSVTPGEHHLCANWPPHSALDKYSAMVGVFAKMVSMQTVIAEAGKVYYFGSDASKRNAQNDMGYDFDFDQLSDDDGKYRVKDSKLATSKPSK